MCDGAFAQDDDTITTRARSSARVMARMKHLDDTSAGNGLSGQWLLSRGQLAVGMSYPRKRFIALSAESHQRQAPL